MITDLQKNEIDKKYFPNGYFYQTRNFNPKSRERGLNEPFESLESYDSSVKSLRHSNALKFFLTIKKIANEIDFIKEINNQYLNYCLENYDNAKLWLSLTYDLVLKGFSVSGKIEDINLRGAFIRWYNKKLSEINGSQNNLVEGEGDAQNNVNDELATPHGSYKENQENKKKPKIKALFQFIQFLYSNIDNFNQYNDLIKELELLDRERNKLSPENNYKDKLQYDKVQAELESKFKILQDNTANLIKAKAQELNVCNFENEPNYSFNGVEAEIHQHKKDFDSEDLTIIFKRKSQYLEYRTNTHKTFLSLQFFFDELDEITKALFDFFKNGNVNEFAPFEQKEIKVNSMTEIFKHPQRDNAKFIISKSNESKEPKQDARIEINKETLSDQITHLNNIEIAKEIQIKYRSFKGYRLRILLEALKELDLFPKGKTDALFHRCCKNDFIDAGSYPSMEKHTFKRGYLNAKGVRIKTDHEEIFDSIVVFLKSIMNS